MDSADSAIGAEGSSKGGHRPQVVLRQRRGDLQSAPTHVAIPPIVTHATKELARKAEITNDHFVRTTDKEHKEAVEYAWVRSPTGDTG
jgi:hypothetical protein